MWRFAVVALVVGCVSPIDMRAQSPDASAEFRAIAQQARLLGMSSYDLPRPIEEYGEQEQLDAALQHTTLTLANLVASVPVAEGTTIVTWKKYRIIEQFSKEDVHLPMEGLPKSVPKSLLPLRPGEFLLAETGGTLTVDGVQITMRPPARTPLPAGNLHLMFLVFGASGEVAASNYGPCGMFWVDKDNWIHVRVSVNGNELSDSLIRESGGTLAGLRDVAARAAHPSTNKRRPIAK